MWGPPSKADEKLYKQQADYDKAKRERQAKLQADMSRRMAILARVKTGEITLKEAQEIIKRGFK
ncbi:MAG: hypothetical protein ABIJ35_13380 [Acidobacteriota bacterium]